MTNNGNNFNKGGRAVKFQAGVVDLKAMFATDGRLGRDFNFRSDDIMSNAAADNGNEY